MIDIIIDKFPLLEKIYKLFFSYKGISHELSQVSIFVIENKDREDCIKAWKQRKKDILDFTLYYFQIKDTSECKDSIKNKFLTVDEISFDDLNKLIDDNKEFGIIWFDAEKETESVVVESVKLSSMDKENLLPKSIYFNIGNKYKKAMVFLKEDFPEAIYGKFHEKYKIIFKPIEFRRCDHREAKVIRIYKRIMR